jgi:hypothetical protein
MRDDFPGQIKEELARRVGYICSNPGCRQLTSGPQAGPTGTVNIGVAAHITAASPRGPRYSPDLTAEQRVSAANGVWLCQTCAALVDRDVDRYTSARLGEWKSDCEASAQRRLEQRGAITSDVDGVLVEAERLMPELIGEMRADIQGDQSELVREFVVLPDPGIPYGWPPGHFEYYESSHPGLLNMLSWLEESSLIVDIAPGDMPAYRISPVFQAWLRTSRTPI